MKIWENVHKMFYTISNLCRMQEDLNIITNTKNMEKCENMIKISIKMFYSFPNIYHMQNGLTIVTKTNMGKWENMRKCT